MATTRRHPAAGARTAAALGSLAAFGGLGIAFAGLNQQATSEITTETDVDATTATTAAQTDDWSATTSAPSTTVTGAASGGATGQSRTNAS